MGDFKKMEKSEIKELKKVIRDIEFEKPFENELRRNYQKSSRDYFARAKFFIEAYKYLSDDFKTDETIKAILEKLKDIDKIRDLFDSYGDGNEYNAYWIEDKIKDYVKEHLEIIEEISKLFYQLYLEGN